MVSGGLDLLRRESGQSDEGEEEDDLLHGPTVEDLLRTGELGSGTEVSGYLVDSTAFKAVGTSDPRSAGSIPVHLRQQVIPGSYT